MASKKNNKSSSSSSGGVGGATTPRTAPNSPFFHPSTPRVVVVQQTTPRGTRRTVPLKSEVTEHKSSILGCTANMMNAIVGTTTHSPHQSLFVDVVGSGLESGSSPPPPFASATPFSFPFSPFPSFFFFFDRGWHRWDPVRHPTGRLLCGPCLDCSSSNFDGNQFAMADQYGQTCPRGFV